MNTASSDRQSLTINFLSESEFGFKWNGVHTAYLNTLAMMRREGGFGLKVNAVRKFDLLHAHTFGPLYWLLCWLNPAPRIVHAHTVPETMVGQISSKWLWMPFITRYMRIYFNSAERVICMTRQLKAELLAMGVRRPISVLPLPMDLGPFKPDPALRKKGRQTLGLGPRDRVVVCAGQIIRRKGFVDFLETARLNPGIHFVWVGELPFWVITDGYSQAKETLRQPPANVHFPGVFELGRMPELYNAADIFLFASLHETFGLVIAEAAACGLPLVLRDLATYRETFGQAYASAQDAHGFSAAIRGLFASKTVMRKARQRSLSLARRLSNSSRGQALAKIYTDVLRAAA